MRPLLLALAGVALGAVAIRAAGAQLPAFELPQLDQGGGASSAGGSFNETVGDVFAGFADAVERTLAPGVDVREVVAVTPEANVAAFLAMIRDAEGTAGPEGYRTLFGGGLFESFEDHPRRVVTARLGGMPISSSAAGAYQFMPATWDEARRALGLADFSPGNQDAAAVFLIKRRGALEDVRAGRFDAAVAKVAKEWASMPGSPYGQPVKTLAHVRAVYENAGGGYA